MDNGENCIIRSFAKYPDDEIKEKRGAGKTRMDATL
jgi:hypothetical protein